MLTLEGYEIRIPFYESSHSVIYSAKKTSENLPVILKKLRNDFPTAQEIESFKKEFELIKSFNHESIIEAHELIKHKNTFIMVLEDFGGHSLAESLAEGAFAIADFMKLAQRIVGALKVIHGSNIMHKDINPSNILWNPHTDQVKITDFGISTTLSKQHLEAGNPDFMEGTLAYMSPEQTGRMNRSVDYRTDFYSLGISFYEMLSGELPFQTEDTLETVLCHLARIPLSLSDLKPSIPKVLAKIVDKLMAKSAEDRYQSIDGLLYDLRECEKQYQQSQSIDYFEIASQDTSHRFQLSQKIYGRANEINALTKAYQRVCNEEKELFLLIGSSGVGKSMLPKEIYKQVTERKGFFIKGVSDPGKNSVPYYPLIQGFRQLIQIILTEEKEVLESWKKKILRAIGSNGRILTDILPDLEMIIGPQPEVVSLSSAENRNRFNLVFLDFMRVFVVKGRPLVIFLDDIQWADEATLVMVEQLLTDLRRKNLLLIATYREEQVNPDHKLLPVLEKIKTAGTRISKMTLGPLTIEDIEALIADSLTMDAADVSSLAKICQLKTGGNPHALMQFLSSAQQENQLWYDSSLKTWKGDLEKIRQQPVSENVVDAMTSRIKSLSSQTKEILLKAACIGNQFDLETLAIAHDKKPGQVVDDLAEALHGDLIIEINGGYEMRSSGNPEQDRRIGNSLFNAIEYRFQHNKIRQAAYSLIDNDRKKELHLKIGWLFYERLPHDEAHAFLIASQLNAAIDSDLTEEEKTKISRLNLFTAQKAKNTAAYDVAAKYIQTGIQLLGPAAWEEEYQLSLALHVEAVEIAYLCGDYDRLQKLKDVALEKARSLMDEARVLEFEILRFYAVGKPAEALETGLETLKKLGISLPKKPNKSHILSGFLRTRFLLGKKRNADLETIEDMVDEKALLKTRLIDRVGHSAYSVNPILLPIIIFQVVRQSVLYGNSPETAFGFAGYGSLLANVFNDIKTGHQFGQTALSLANRQSNIKSKAKTCFIVEAFITHRTHHVRETLQPLMAAYQTGLKTGSIEYAAFSVHAHCAYSFMAGELLTSLHQKIETFRSVLTQLKQAPILSIFGIYQQTVSNLLSKTGTAHVLSGKFFSEEKTVSLADGVEDKTFHFFLYLNKMQLAYWFDQYPQAKEFADSARKTSGSVLGSFQFITYYFYDSLVQLADPGLASGKLSKTLNKRINQNLKILKKWAHHAPMNHLHRLNLVQAELARVKGDKDQAIEKYEQAILLAREYKFLHEEALANKLLAIFWLNLNKQEVSAVYLNKADYLLRLWGANALVEHFEETFNFSFTSASPVLAKAKSGTKNRLKRSGPGGTTAASFVDMETIMKASQALSREVRLERLLENMVLLVMENAGATRCVFLVEDETQLLIQAEGNISKKDVLTMQEIPFHDFRNIPHSIINYSARTHTPVVLNDAPKNEAYTNDVYIRRQKPKSVLSIPIIHLGKLVGILYLENNLITGAFTPDRLELLRILSSQAAISMENAGFYKTLEKSEKRFRSIYERAVEGIFLCDETGTFVSANPAMVKMMGYESEEELLNSISIFDNHPFVEADEGKKFLAQLSTRSQVVGHELQVYKKDKTPFWISLSAQLTRNPDNTILHIDGIALDVTQRKQKEEAERLQKAAEAATKSKSDFLANMSHEIRTPLNVMLGTAELLAESSLTPEQRGFVSTFQSSGEQLLNIINDILDFSKIEAKQVILEKIPINLENLIEDTINMMSISAHAKGLELMCRIAPGVNPYCMGDPFRIKQILINLLANAIKFTHAGEVVLEVKSDAEQAETLHFTVSDTGIGIAQERMETIFKSFSQADSSTTRKYGGTGLGLAICKRLIELMDGTISVDSELGLGSRFNFNISLEPDNDARLVVSDGKPDLDGLQILIIDDNETNCEIIKELLTVQMAKPRTMRRAIPALDELIRAEKTGSPYQLVILNYNVPDMNGTELLERLSLLGLSPAPNILLMVTEEEVNANTIDKEIPLTGYLVKPVKRSDLLEKINLLQGNAIAAKKEESSEIELQSPSKRILLAEDIEANCMIIKLYLKDTPITLDIAQNGIVTCDMYKKNRHDLILMDIQMPEMDGLEAMRSIRSWEQKHNIAPVPIIALTAHAFAHRKQECYDAGCTDFLSKPVKKKELLSKLYQLFELPFSQSIEEDGQPADLAHSDNYEVSVDAFLEELIPEFFEEIRQELGKMKTAVNANDFDTLIRLGHGFKGASRNYCLEDLAKIFLDIEVGAKNGQMADIATHLRKVETFLDHVVINYG